MRRLILTTAAALSIAAIPAFAGAQQQTANPNLPAPGDTTAVPSDQTDHSATAAANSSADTSASASGTADVTTGAGAGVEYDASSQAIGAPPASYPLCRGNVQDECVNPREAGKNFGNRPLKYWPGKPASE